MTMTANDTKQAALPEGPGRRGTLVPDPAPVPGAQMSLFDGRTD